MAVEKFEVGKNYEIRLPHQGVGEGFFQVNCLDVNHSTNIVLFNITRNTTGVQFVYTKKVKGYEFGLVQQLSNVYWYELPT